MSRVLNFIIEPERDGSSVYNYLRRTVRLSSHLLRTLKHRENGLMLNGEPVRTVDILSAGDTLTLNLPEDENSIEPRFGELDIVYEDEDLLVVNKPAGLAVHPTHNHQGDTLANLVAGYYYQKGYSPTFRTVGRLDKDTSGLVVCALNAHCAAKLSGEIEKEYLAVVQGIFDGEGTINRPIYRPDPMKTLRAAGDEGRGEPAVTHWRALRTTDSGLTLLSIHLETGRTHQIRVHFSSIGAPLAGDEMYGGSRELIGRHALHCAAAEFTHPITGKKVRLCTGLPEDMQGLLEKRRED